MSQQSTERAEFSPAIICFRNEEVPSEELVQTFTENLSISAVTAKILIGRNLKKVEDAKAFLSPTLQESLKDPREMKNLETAADLLLETIEKQEQITVYSDFDVDGLSSGAELYLYIRSLGGVVNHYVPNRFTEGYGLVKSAVEKLGQAGTKLLVTVDCGVTSHEELALAESLGMKTVVIDHHQLDGSPPADIVVDPAQEGCPFQEDALCAAGLVWMLLIMLRMRAKERGIGDIKKLPDPKDFLDLAALGTICDMVPLRGLNRVIAFRGIEAIEKTKRPGLIALKEVSGLGEKNRVNAGHISFALGPRINAAGRLGEAKEVFELLTTGNSKKAKLIASRINKANTKRRSVEERVLEGCLMQIDKSDTLRNKAAFALFGDDFHLGVIGIAAQRLVERFHRPAAVMGPGEMTIDGKTVPVVKGSVRSISGFHVSEVLNSLGGMLLAGGGHELAGGFTVAFEKRIDFQQAFIQKAEEQLSSEELRRQLKVDVEVKLSEISFGLVEELGALAPFGIGNASPLLVSKDVLVESVKSLAGGHLRFKVSDGEQFVQGVAWRYQGHPLLKKGNRVSIAYQAELNTYQGISSVQLNLKEVWQ